MQNRLIEEPDKLKEEIQNTKVSLSTTKDKNDYVVLLEGEHQKVYPLSKYNPRKHAETIVNEKIKNKEMSIILFGFGGGYILEEVIRLVDEQARILVIDPDLKAVKEQIECRKLGHLFKIKNIAMYEGENEQELLMFITQAVDIVDANNIALIVTPNYENFYKEHVNQVISVIKKIRANSILNKNTMNKYNILHIDNCMRNRLYANKGYDIRKHRNKYENIPALIVAAGPSLSKNIKYVKEFKGITFAMGRVLDTLLNNGGVPDFLVSLDPTDLSADTYKNSLVNNYPLIATSISSPKVVENNSGPKYFIHNHLAAREIWGEDIPTLFTGGSVANTMCSMAYYMGCNPIIFIGQDLAYTDGLLHDKNASGQTSGSKEVDLYVEGYYGELVATDWSLNTFLMSFEEFIRNNDDRTYINATEGGAHIKGTTRRPFKEVIKEYENYERINIEHKEQNKQLIVEGHIESIVSELEEAKTIVLETLKKCEKIKKKYMSYDEEKESIKRLMQEINEVISKEKIGKRVLIILDNFIESKNLEIEFNRKYNTPIWEDEIGEGIRVIKNLEELFNGIDESIDVVLGTIGKYL